MTTAADDSAVEDAFEAILAGRPVPERAAGLAAFTGAVRASATTPGRPNAALAELLATGLLADQSSPSVRTARSAGSAPERRPSRVRTRRRSAMILPALIAKFLSAGAVAQAATGAAVVVVAVTGVGAAGALPAPVQDTFSTVVAAVTPLEPPTSEEETTEEVVSEETVVEDVATEETPATELTEEAWAENGPADGQSFGAWVSEGAENGWVDGQVISEWAHKRNAERKGQTAPDETVEDDTVVEDTDGTTDDTTADETVTEDDEVTVAESTTRGNGKGNGNGRGNGKN